MGFLLWPPALFPAQKVLTGDRIPVAGAELMVHPVHHASVVLGWKGLVIYVDPVGGAGRYSSLPQPDLILITHAHSDHLDIDTLKALAHENTAVVAPSGVLKRLPDPLRTWARSLDNGQAKRVVGVGIEAIPAYNLAGERQKYHPKGRGNGYVLTLDSTRVYLSGDTEDIAEMRALTNIHVAFVCMNLPYTMSVEQAASAVRAFRPRIVYPYHYRGSDLDTFKRLVGTEGGIEVRLRDWYKEP
ncbi:MAG: MBL fold metallo-hydrolase [Verrucomicrobia bacterium]|nr:MBL fold metallo-hydrolase [Verrucomicrobiota bacterium]